MAVKLDEEWSRKEYHIEEKLFVKVRLCFAVELEIYDRLYSAAEFNVFWILFSESGNYLRKFIFRHALAVAILNPIVNI